jgi:hypothetical protein
MNVTKKTLSKIMTAVWVIGLILSGFLLSVPPARVPIFIGLTCIAMFPLIFGSRRYQIFGIVAVAGSLMLTYWEYEAGLRHKARMEHFRQKITEQHSATNIQPSEINTP